MKQPIETSLIKSPQLLLVDDDPEHLSQMVAWLGSRPARLFQARSAEQARKILARHAVDGLITDWQMPGLSGLDLIELLRADGFRGPLLICTGLMLEPEDLQRAFAAGASDYLRKPLNRIEFLSRLEHSLQLYAQRELLRRFSQSQSRLIEDLSQTVGTQLQRLLLSQRQEAPQTPQQQFQHQTVERLSEQFSQLMLWARYRFSLSHLQPARIELRPLLHSLVQNAGAQGQRLLLRGGKELFVEADPELLQRVMAQLLDNALRYSPGLVTLKVSEQGERLRISVQDTGDSLSEGDAARLSQNQQTGMGLRICHELLGLLGSRLDCRLRRGGGASFSFELARA